MADVVALAAIVSSIIFLYGEDVITALVTRTLVRVFPGAETIDVGEQAFNRSFSVGIRGDMHISDDIHRSGQDGVFIFPVDIRGDMHTSDASTRSRLDGRLYRGGGQ